MQKPVNVLHSCDAVSKAMATNHKQALRTALLLLPGKFSEYELYCTIASLSYAGDFRMTFGENPKKIHNIVSGNFEAFQRLYSDYIRNEPSLSVINSSNDFSQDANIVLTTLPKNLLTHIMQNNNKVDLLSKDMTCRRRKVVKQCLQNIVS